VQWRGQVDTLSNGAIRVQNPDVGLWDSASTWRLQEDLRIGSTAGGPQAFGMIRDFDVDLAGRIYILDGSANEIRVFNSDGQFVRAVGRSGDGPGEFRQPAGISVAPNGGFWIADPTVNRYTQFDSSGVVLQTLTAGLTASWYLMFPWQGTVDSLGRVHLYSLSADGARIVRFAPSLDRADTFPVPYRQAAEIALVDQTGELRASMPVPFSPAIVRHIARNGLLWFGANERYEIINQTLEGDTVRIIGKAFRPVAVSDAERTAALQPVQQFISHGGKLEGPDIPQFKPAYDWLVVDDHSYLWVRPHLAAAADVPVLEVFDDEGRYLGSMQVHSQLDPEILPIVIGSHIYAIVRDELDVQYLTRARIVGR
jgi:hypothetical protein